MNFDGHIAYVRVDSYGVRMDLMSWTSDGIIGIISIGWRVWQCVGAV